ncbi:MAG: GIY-YIG nuclease family protein [Desulfobacula sp.]|nr:GIY-YIG nuclease family protein [Desulfobacula sp.]
MISKSNNNHIDRLYEDFLKKVADEKRNRESIENERQRKEKEQKKRKNHIEFLSANRDIFQKLYYSSSDDFEHYSVEELQEIYKKTKDEKQRIKIETIEKGRIEGKWNKIQPILKFEILQNEIKSNEPGIYAIIDYDSHKYYIGSSQNMLHRKSAHLSGLENNKHHSYKLQNLFNERGPNKLRFFAIEVGGKDKVQFTPTKYKPTFKQQFNWHLKSLEQKYINMYAPE